MPVRTLLSAAVDGIRVAEAVAADMTGEPGAGANDPRRRIRCGRRGNGYYDYIYTSGPRRRLVCARGRRGDRAREGGGRARNQ